MTHKYRLDEGLLKTNITAIDQCILLLKVHQRDRIHNTGRSSMSDKPVIAYYSRTDGHGQLLIDPRCLDYKRGTNEISFRMFVIRCTR